MSSRLGTILTAMVTPFDAAEAVDHGRLAQLAEFLLANGSDGLVVAGTTGESPTLSDDEKLEMFRTVVAAAGGRASVVAGTGSNDTRHSIELTRAAEACGVDAVLAVVPYYNKPPERGVLAHFRAIAAATSLPVIVYNIPGRCVINLSPEALAELGAHGEHRRRQAGQPGPRRDRPADGTERPGRLRRQRRHAVRRHVPRRRRRHLRREPRRRAADGRGRPALPSRATSKPPRPKTPRCTSCTRRCS